MILSHFFSRMAKLCVTWDSGRISAKTTTPVTCDRRIDYNGTVFSTVDKSWIPVKNSSEVSRILMRESE